MDNIVDPYGDTSVGDQRKQQRVRHVHEMAIRISQSAWPARDGLVHVRGRGDPFVNGEEQRVARHSRGRPDVAVDTHEVLGELSRELAELDVRGL
jgi:hypothetical protein